MIKRECALALLVQADIDGELDAGRAADLIRHRADCPDCQAAYADLMMLRDRLRDGDLRERAPDSLRHFLARQSAAMAPPVKPRRWYPQASFVIGPALAACIAFALFRPAAPDPLALVVDAHVRALQPGHLQDVVSTDRHTVKPWFEGKLDFAPPVKDLAAQQFPLTGGRLDVLDGRAVAAMVYQRGTHPINLLAWPAGKDGDHDPVTQDAKGFTTIHWVQNGMILWAVSDLERSQLEEFVRLWRIN
ncbi:MAG TPA: anti-sigma factor [Magnetospirillaceae bacterium]|nr:anti-sigma factor [Magnetospirillaceae bacterium]